MGEYKYKALTLKLKKMDGRRSTLNQKVKEYFYGGHGDVVYELLFRSDWVFTSKTLVRPVQHAGAF